MKFFIRDNFPFFGKINSKTKSFDPVELIKLAHPKALAALEQITITQRNECIISFLTAIIKDPLLSSHDQMLSLLSVIGNTNFPVLIEYIVSLENLPFPNTKYEGTFFARENQSVQQAACTQFLKNVAFKPDTGNDLWNKANSLLQTSLLISYNVKKCDEASDCLSLVN